MPAPEHRYRRQFSSGEVWTTGWDIGAISQALRQEPHLTRDSVHGPGVRYRLGEQRPLEVELFPPDGEQSSGVVRLSTADTFQEFFRQPAPTIREDGLVFATKEILISLSPAGNLMIQRTAPDIGPERSRDALPNAEAPMRQDEEEGGSSGDYTPSQRASQDPLPTPDRQRRVEYGGRLGTPPRTKTTRTGRFVLEFPVAVHLEDRDKPEWRATVVFDAKARQLEGQLEQGTYVDVVAYEHTKRTVRRGKRQDRKEYYATSVTPRSKLRQRNHARE